MKMNKQTIIGLILCLGLVLSINLAAQSTNDVPVKPPTATDEAIRGWFSQFSAWQMFLVPAVTVLIMGFRKVVAIVPDQLWPWLAPFIGAGLDYAASMAGFWTGSGQVGLLMGGLAVWFSQLGKQTLELKKEGPTITASGVSALAGNGQSAVKS